MKLTVTEAQHGKTVQFDVGDELTFSAFQTLVADEFHDVPLHDQHFMVSGRLLLPQPGATLKSLILQEQDVIVLFGTSSTRTTDQELQAVSATLQARVQEQPDLLEVLQHTNPQLSNALRANDQTAVQRAVAEQASQSRETAARHARAFQMLLRDPLNPEAQAFLLQAIQQKQIDEAYAHAQEYLPESFASVSMLYVPIEVNGTAVKAFVDTGAQATIMSLRCAENCGLTRLIDRRFQGLLKGVGTSVMVGRIHVAQLKIGNSFFAASLTILEHDKMDFLFGLDLLRRYQCTIDLKKQHLLIAEESVPFLSEALLREDTPDPSSTQKPTAELNVPSTAAPSEKERSIQQLLELGFPRSVAEHALQQTNGDVRSAASLLFHDIP